ncbi:sensor histidine kinase [Streptomyces melanogenes]|uniref:sensor histidine kinase n=1 Tax=Streptomyces melanogenes TaxID=67326 RepID=UPI00167CCD64|nr:histidine kinase [Streptomyces melanogenes]GGP59146.1 two-component sensor histidine kinase [Streptomyces melanogenes]
MNRAGPEYRWLLPSAVVAPELPGDRPEGRAPRRTVRDWVVDTCAFLCAALIGVLAADAMNQASDYPEPLQAVDQLVGAVACCAVWLRRRWPVQLAAVLVAVTTVAPVASGALLVALFSLAVHRPLKPAVALVGTAAVASAVLQPVVRPDPHTGLLANAITGTVMVLLSTGWGMLVRARRQLVVALRERAVRAEAEAALRAENAQRLAREAIAREMHDVLAHRLTLLSVHAGALEFRPDAPPAEVARAAGVIRDSAHEALQDLRQIIGVLRSPDEGAEDRPQPTLATLDALVAESREAGMKVTLDSRIGDPDGVPAATGRNAYRIAQEALTNARKHAPGAEVTVTVNGRPGDGLTVEVRNPAPVGDVPKVPGSGQGLIGLTERATLAGGRLEHGRTPGGGFEVRAWLPWPS